jgi:HlyD family secretion protein
MKIILKKKKTVIKKQPQKVSIETTRVEKGSISTTITATGTIQPTKQVAVGTQVSGVVQKIYVDFNSKVKAGQLLAELDKTNLISSVNEAKANYNTALNEVKYLEKIFERQSTLFKNKSISQNDYDEALYKLNNAKGTLEQRKFDLDKMKSNLGYADIYSPIDGVVLSKSVDVGQTVAASFSTPTLFTIAEDLRQMQVEANVDEADIGNVKIGQRVTFTVDAYQGEEFSGTVTQVRMNATTTSNVVTYKVIVKADNPDKKLLPGLTATISIYTLELKDVLTLNAQAFNFNPDMEMVKVYNAQFSDKPVENSVRNTTPQKDKHKKTVWIKDASGIHPIEVTIGSNDGVNSEVVSGLKQGEEVVISMGYQTATTVVKKDGTSESPFMPKPPGKKK